MKIVRRTSVVVEKLVVLAKWGEPDLVKLLDPNLPEHEGWELDWYRPRRRSADGELIYKFVLTRERDYTVLVDSEKRQ